MYLEIFTGPTSSGKTTAAQTKYRQYSKRLGCRLGVFNPTKNTRDRKGFIRSHSGYEIPATQIANLMEIDTNQYDVIIIEEAQWFDDLVEFIESNRNSPCRFYVFGLISDINRNKFGHIADIIHLASNITFYHSVCEYCGDDSSFTKRKGDIKERDVPGGDELYYTVCYKHVCSETK